MIWLFGYGLMVTVRAGKPSKIWFRHQGSRKLCFRPWLRPLDRSSRTFWQNFWKNMFPQKKTFKKKNKEPWLRSKKFWELKNIFFPDKRNVFPEKNIFFKKKTKSLYFGAGAWLKLLSLALAKNQYCWLRWLWSQNKAPAPQPWLLSKFSFGLTGYSHHKIFQLVNYEVKVTIISLISFSMWLPWLPRLQSGHCNYDYKP